MLNITIKETSIIRPARETPGKCLWNSGFDLIMMPKNHTSVLFFYKPNGSVAFFQAQVLKEALSNVLVPFYPMAGRLGRDESGRIEIICNAEGALFIEAEADGVLNDLSDFAPSSQLQQLVPTVDYSRDISSYPLLLIQVTTFKCGGTSLGVLSHHGLADGSSGFHFINSWSEMARGHSLSISPFIDRTILQSLMLPTPAFDHTEFDPPSSMNTPISSLRSACLFKITKDQLNNLRAESNKTGDTARYSSYSILAAHVWRCVSKARGLSDDQPTKLFIPINGRPRFRPPLPQGYFGNAIILASTIALSGDLLSEPFSNTVERIHKTLKQFDDAYFKSALTYVEKVPSKQTIFPQENTFQCPNLCINSWWRFPTNYADFGWGRPIFLGRTTIGEGKSYIIPSPTDDGSVTLMIGLETSHMKLFQKLICN
ncbi:hypothetical protein SLEP1_g1664 [Rubroshorea leprosula]|uniref:Uncharacterized protein n=1 Tax=Rubroshorea leprosula TaxID=152421 RepID=A0AAV5HLM6_9ROSI|nr:hypothetical protein SLEP1_g1664 [Rubroshorea leprosula]